MLLRQIEDHNLQALDRGMRAVQAAQSKDLALIATPFSTETHWKSHGRPFKGTQSHYSPLRKLTFRFFNLSTRSFVLLREV
jgi:hypothetical protein